MAAAPLAHLMACSSRPVTGMDAGVTTGWATGGTAAMTGNYPDPFAGKDLGSSCVLTCAQMQGPCYAATLVRKDISEGHAGLPMRLALRVVDEACMPIAGAEVDVWHTLPEGVYSGADADPFCTQNDPLAESGQFFRGVQITDKSGRVDFDTCFPGWYAGRTIHVHFTIRIGASEYLTSQLYFDDALSDEIVATQPLYKDRGPRDTNNASDGVIAATAVGDYILQGEQMPDGALLAWKTLVIRSSLDTALCAAPRGTGDLPLVD